MTVYVDPLFSMTPRTTVAQRYGILWCHMFTDQLDLAELHAIARAIGLGKSSFQNDNPDHPHYDLVPSKRRLVVQNGAVEVSGDELMSVLAAQTKMRRDALLALEAQKEREWDEGLWRE